MPLRVPLGLQGPKFSGLQDQMQSQCMLSLGLFGALSPEPLVLTFFWRRVWGHAC